MQANGLKAYDYAANGPDLVIVLGCTMEEALAMDTASIEVRTDAGDLAEVFAGYSKRSATVDVATGRVTLSLYLDTEGAGPAVSALAGKVTESVAAAEGAQKAAGEAQTAAAEAKEATVSIQAQLKALAGTE